MRKRAAGRDEAGIGLVEMLIAIVILSTALIGTAGEVATYIKHQELERAQAQANHIASAWFEYAESQSRSLTQAEAANTTSGNAPASTTGLGSLTAVNPLPKVNGVTYTETVTLYSCPASSVTAATFNPAAGGSGCTRLTGTNGSAFTATSVLFATVGVSWRLGGETHSLSVSRNIADNTTYQPQSTQGNGLTSCPRAAKTNSDGSAALSGLSLTFASGSPSSTNGPTNRDYVSGTSPAIHPALNALGASISTVAATFTERGLENSTYTTPQPPNNWGPPACVPLTWTDDATSVSASGTTITSTTHRVDMHLASACSITAATLSTQACSYSALIPTALITATQATPANAWDESVGFCAWALGSGTTCPVTNSVTAYGQAQNYYVDVGPYVSSCTSGTLHVATSNLQSKGDTNLTCTTANLVSTSSDTLTVSALGTVIATLTHTAPSNSWSGKIAAGKTVTTSCSVLGGCNVTLTFTVTRAADGAKQLPSGYTFTGCLLGTLGGCNFTTAVN
ncbi:MAG TPA: hypothetical protein VG650_03150 [Mycobacteriales bacterium]|nr:hypothetical protein [Mycobacteriales bacterium]